MTVVQLDVVPRKYAVQTEGSVLADQEFLVELAVPLGRNEREVAAVAGEDVVRVVRVDLAEVPWDFAFRGTPAADSTKWFLKKCGHMRMYLRPFSSVPHVSSLKVRAT